MVDIMLKQPVRLQIGGGLDKEGKRQPVEFVLLSAGLNRNVPDKVASHPYLQLHLRDVPRPQIAQTFSAQQIEMLNRLGLSPQQRQALEQMQLTSEQRAALVGPERAPGAEVVKPPVDDPNAGKSADDPNAGKSADDASIGKGASDDDRTDKTDRSGNGGRRR